MAKGLSRLCSAQHCAGIEHDPARVSQLTVTHLSHKPWVCVNPMKKLYITSSVLQPARLQFCMQDCCSLIAQVEYQGQAGYTRILECKSWIDMSFAFKKNAWIDRSFCIGFFSYFIFLLRDQWMFERLGKANWWGFGQQQLLANSIISHEKRGDLLLPYIYKAIKPFWLSNWVSLARVVACFPKVSLSLPAAPAADSKTPCVCASPSDQPKLCWSAAPSAWPLILQSKSSIVFSNSLLEWLPDDQHGLKLGLKLELCLLTNWLYKFYLFWNPRIKFNKLCGVWILFRTPKLRAAYQSSITRLHSTVTVIGVYFHFTDVLLNAHWAALWPQQYQLSPTRLHSTVIGVEIFSLHRCFAQCSLSSSLTSEKC